MPSLNLRNPLRRDPNRPTLKQRAAALKATAARLIRKTKPLPATGSPVADGADPRLVAMVAEWQDVRRKLNDPAVLDGPEADALGEEHSTRQLEIYLYPARSALDLFAKLPALRDELEDAKRGSTNSLPVAAWTGLLADIERIAGTAAAPADAELIALGHAFDAATIRHREACDVLDAAEDRAEPLMPERPAALIYREGDNLFPLREYGDAFAGIAVSPSDIEWMTRRPAQHEVWVDNPSAQPGVSMVPGKKPRIVHWPEAQARIDEIVAAWDAWHAEQDRVMDEAGVTDARAVTDEASDAAAAIARQATALPARTLAGAWVKVRIAAFYGVADPTASPAEGYTGEAALRSLYRDAPRLVLNAETADIRIVPEAGPTAAAAAGRSAETHDADLIALGRAFDAAAAGSWDAERAHEADRFNSEKRIAADKAGESVRDLAEQIAPLPVHTLAGMRVKLRLAAFYGACLPYRSDEEEDNGEIAIRSLYQSTPGIVLGADRYSVRIVPEA